MEPIDTNAVKITLATIAAEDAINERLKVSSIIQDAIENLSNEEKLITISKLYFRYGSNSVFGSQIRDIAKEVLSYKTSGVLDVAKSEGLSPKELQNLLVTEAITPFQALTYIHQFADTIEDAREFLNMNVELYEPIHKAIKQFTLGER